MRIGFDAKRLFQNNTGLGNYSRTLVGNLHQYFPEHDLHLFAPKLVENDRTQPFINDQYKIVVPHGPSRLGWRSMGVVRAMKRHDIQLYHGLSHEIPIGIKQSEIPSVVTIHDLLYKYFPEDFHVVDRYIYDSKFRFACENATKIIAISEATKKDIVEHYHTDPSRIEVLYQTVSPAFSNEVTEAESAVVKAKYNLPSEYILNVGAIISRKNLLVLVEALAIIPEEKRLPLVIVGTGNKYQEQVDEKIAELNLTKWLIRIPGPSLHELNVLYRNAQLSVYPSLMEGFGLPVLESITAGTPVITTNRSSLTEAGGDIAQYIDGKNAEELASLILDNHSGKISPADPEKVVAHINKFNPKVLTEQLNELYKSCIVL